MPAIWEQKANVRESIMRRLVDLLKRMTRPRLEAFARDISSHTCAHMTLTELKSWDSKLKSEAEAKAKGG